jgi:hypothetical protein
MARTIRAMTILGRGRINLVRPTSPLSFPGLTRESRTAGSEVAVLDCRVGPGNDKEGEEPR